MANEEVLGPRKTMFVLVIVVGCFAVLWPRILSPLVLGHTRDQLKPNQFDRDAGCCEVMFETDLAVLELINEVCNSAVQATGKLSPYAAAQCRKAVNETCGMDIAVFLKRTENVGKTSKMLVQTMQSSNSSCLKEHFGVTTWSHGPHQAINSWNQPDTMKQERSSVRGGPHPALLERGRAIPPGPQAPSRPVAMPPHLRVRSPLSVYYELDIKPPPIPGMRPPLGSPGGPVPAPKSSMGFVMPIYTICIIVFFVYTLSKILFKRTGSPYEPVNADPQFRRRVFRDDSRTSPDKLGPKERDARDVELEALRARLAETERAMQRIVGQLGRRDADAQDTARPYTNGTILHNTGPVHIVTSEYRDVSKERSPEPLKNNVQQPKEFEETTKQDEVTQDPIETSADLIDTLEKLDKAMELQDSLLTWKDFLPDSQNDDLDTNGALEKIEVVGQIEDTRPEKTEFSPENNNEAENGDYELLETNEKEIDAETKEIEELLESYELNHKEDEFIKLTESSEDESDVAKLTEYFIQEETRKDEKREKQSKIESLDNALKEETLEQDGLEEQENATVKVMGMEVTAHSADGGACDREQPSLPAPQQQQQRPHEAEEVQSIFLDTEIPQKSRVLVTDFEENRPEAPKPTNDSPMVVSGKMTLSLIQDAPRETPERDPESTVDDFTTASAVTQPAADKAAIEESDEEIEEEIEVEEIEEEVEEEEEEIEPAKEENKPEAKDLH